MKKQYDTTGKTYDRENFSLLHNWPVKEYNITLMCPNGFDLHTLQVTNFL